MLGNIGKIMAQSSMKLIDGSTKTYTATPEEFVKNVVEIGLGAGGAVAVILVAMGGYSILTSSGNPQKIKDGKEQISNALMGFALILLTVSIINIVRAQFGII